MFKGQPKRPLFKVGDTVHAIPNPTDQTKKPSTTSAARRTSFSSSKETKPIVLPDTAGLNLPPSTLLQITAVQESDTDKTQHSYTMTPVTTPSFTVQESALIPSTYPLGSFVVKKGDVARELAIVRDVSVAVKEGTYGQQEYMIILTISGEIGGVELVEAEKVRAATAKEAEQWFPMDD